jgi:hypothetical protein
VAYAVVVRPFIFVELVVVTLLEAMPLFVEVEFIVKQVLNDDECLTAVTIQMAANETRQQGSSINL